MKKSIFIILLSSLLFGSHFEKSQNIVIDKEQNIMWQDTLEVGQYIIEDITMARIYCEDLILNAYDDWQMPTIKQLQTIIDVEQQKVAIKKEFEFTKSSNYWSNSSHQERRDSFWYVNFETGKVNYTNKNTKQVVRCIRDIK